MSNRRRIFSLSDFTTSVWFMDERSSHGLLHMVRQMLENNSDSIHPELVDTTPQAFNLLSQSVLNSTITAYPISEYGIASPVKNAPPNSVAIIPMIGAITKYDQYYGGAGTETKKNLLLECYANPNIIAVVFQVDSGGGQSIAIEDFTAVINMRNKPVIASISGFGCSGAYWLSSACDLILVSGKLSEVGSIGAYIKYTSFTEYYKRLGIEEKTVYAPQSSLKNKPFEDLQAGDEKAIKNYLEIIASVFIDDVKTNRSNIVDDKEVFKGQTYHSSDAIAIHLADEIGTLNDAILKAHELSNNYQPKSVIQTKSTNTMFGLNKFPHLSSVKGKTAEEISVDLLKLINAELTTEGVSNLCIVKTSELEALSNKNTELVQANAALTTKNTELTEKVVTLEKEDGAPAVDTSKPTDVIVEDPAKKSKETIENLPHMKAANEMLK